MSRLLAYRTQVLADLKVLFPAVKDIETHNGRFTDDDVGRLLLNTPAMRLAYLGSPKTGPKTGGSLLRLVAKFGIYIATRDTTTLKRDAAAIGIGEALMVHIDRDQPIAGGKTLSMMAENVRHDILYSEGIDKKGMLLSAVSWDVGVTVGSGLFEEGTGAVLQSLYADGELLWEAPQ